MKHALIYKPTGRLCQVSDTVFPVHPDLEWHDCADDVAVETHFFDGSVVVQKPVVPEPVVPNVRGFIDDTKAAMGGIKQSNVLAKSYPLYHPALQNGKFKDAEALIIDARDTGVLTPAQYQSFKDLAVKHNIPMVLP